MPPLLRLPSAPRTYRLANRLRRERGLPSSALLGASGGSGFSRFRNERDGIVWLRGISGVLNTLTTRGGAGIYRPEAMRMSRRANHAHSVASEIYHAFVAVTGSAFKIGDPVRSKGSTSGWVGYVRRVNVRDGLAEVGPETVVGSHLRVYRFDELEHAQFTASRCPGLTAEIARLRAMQWDETGKQVVRND